MIGGMAEEDPLLRVEEGGEGAEWRRERASARGKVSMWKGRAAAAAAGTMMLGALAGMRGGGEGGKLSVRRSGREELLGCGASSPRRNDCLRKSVANLFSSPLLDEETAKYMPPVSRGEKYGAKGLPEWAVAGTGGVPLLTPSRDATLGEMEGVLKAGGVVGAGDDDDGDESPLGSMDVIEAASNAAHRDPFMHASTPVHEVEGGQGAEADDVYDPLADPLYNYYDSATRSGGGDTDNIIEEIERPVATAPPPPPPAEAPEEEEEEEEGEEEEEEAPQPAPKPVWGSRNSAQAFDFHIFPRRANKMTPPPAEAAYDHRGLYRNVPLGEEGWDMAGGVVEPPKHRLWRDNPLHEG